MMSMGTLSGIRWGCNITGAAGGGNQDRVSDDRGSRPVIRRTDSCGAFSIGGLTEYSRPETKRRPIGTNRQFDRKVI